MSRRMAIALLRLYPRLWRERYGEELLEMLVSTEDRVPGGVRDNRSNIWRTAFNVAGAALQERMAPTLIPNGGLVMNQLPYTVGSVTRKPSAWLPLVLSLASLFVVLGAVLRNGGPIHEADEGAAAHTWQLLMVIQLPVMAFFAIRWLPKALKPALIVLAVLATVVIANFAAVYFLT